MAIDIKNIGNKGVTATLQTLRNSLTSTVSNLGGGVGGLMNSNTLGQLNKIINKMDTSIETKGKQIDIDAVTGRLQADSLRVVWASLNIKNHRDLMNTDAWRLRLMKLNKNEHDITLNAVGVGASGYSTTIKHDILNQEPYSYTQGNNYKVDYVDQLEQMQQLGDDTTRFELHNDHYWNYGGDHNDLYKISENLYPDELDSGVFTNKWHSENKNSMLYKTKQMFKAGKIATIISSFHTDPTRKGTSLDNAKSKYGLSHGRNLLTKKAERGTSGYTTNGYDNPYCRVWTHHYQYDRLYKRMRPFASISGDGIITTGGDVQSVMGIDEFHQWKNFSDKQDETTKGEYGWKKDLNNGWKYSVLYNSAKTGMPNITPKYLGGGNSNIHTKQCMFSIENLAWRGYDPYSFEQALSWEQRGPMGGRIMWFPPYNLSFQETTATSWQNTSIIGRGEDVYTYTNTVRSGTLNFTLVVDHPSVVDYALWQGGNDVTDTDILRFFAGCGEGDGDGLREHAQPTPLVDEYTQERTKDKMSLDVDKKGNLGAIVETHTEENIETHIVAFAFYPLNYSGVFDRYGFFEGVGGAITLKNVDGTIGCQTRRLTDAKRKNLMDPIDYLLRGKEASLYIQENAEKFEDYNYNEIIGDYGVYCGYEMGSVLGDKQYMFNKAAAQGFSLQEYKDDIRSSNPTAERKLPMGKTAKSKVWGVQRGGTENATWYYYRADVSLIYPTIGGVAVDADLTTMGLQKQITGEPSDDNNYKPMENKDYLNSLLSAANVLGRGSTKGKTQKDDKQFNLNKSITSLYEELKGLVYSENPKEPGTKVINLEKEDDGNIKLIGLNVTPEHKTEIGIESYTQVISLYDLERIIKDEGITEADKERLGPIQERFEKGKLAKVTVCGFASPAGHSSCNQMLAYSRGRALSGHFYNLCKERGMEIPKDKWVTFWDKSTQDLKLNDDDEMSAAANKASRFAVISFAFEKVTNISDGQIKVGGYGGDENLEIPADFQPVISSQKDKEGNLMQDTMTIHGEVCPVFTLYRARAKSVLGDNDSTNRLVEPQSKWVLMTVDGRKKMVSVESLNEGDYVEEYLNPPKARYGNGSSDKNFVRYDQEYLFFKQLKNSDPLVFQSLVDKLQYFDPAFHSMTPEGFNGRLTFLQQCMRQGNTVSASDSGAKSANNLAFGRAPYCVLRLGDFYNQMIIIDNMSISYDPLVWDTNIEGIGMQPLLANVTLSFKFIGGGDLTGPIRRLQNAMSFNYYANARLYDNRADMVERYWSDKTNGALEHGEIIEEELSHNPMDQLSRRQEYYKQGSKKSSTFYTTPMYK